MTADDADRARRLYELLLGRSGRKEQLRKMIEEAEAFADFRVMLVRNGEEHEGLAEVLSDWRRRLAAWHTETDDRKLLHDLEVLMLKQRDIEKLLKANESILIDKLRALDSAATELLELNQKVREVRAAMEAHRQLLSDLATRAQ